MRFEISDLSSKCGGWDTLAHSSPPFFYRPPTFLLHHRHDLVEPKKQHRRMSDVIRGHMYSNATVPHVQLLIAWHIRMRNCSCGGGGGGGGHPQFIVVFKNRYKCFVFCSFRSISNRSAGFLTDVSSIISDLRNSNRRGRCHGLNLEP